ncbi:RagB/SusD family nutrient uptake outer membrane protein [Parabacteroides sp. 52]|uniref:RagB/SusD family nutrient uptake outer membrane protein n=1 Tax=unclassified Parabacteroides TaxID=2649774 RepID=UPI0013D56374|nr:MULTISPECIES: RagB/SusD family nutrient uptake outer membrane protein [unclassified Parabacteroides]MDH6534870.1 hypothetical protein [Parabacteroides sp. PM5-20]NDV55587.1 RagB/SusD family nutrient uptake outer membrane protein [Parabacteroides sp. 52]
MKKYIFLISLLITSFSFQSCDDMLDQYPKDKVSPETFFSTENELKLYTNSLLFLFPATSLYTEGADNIVKQGLEDEIAGIRDASTGSGWTWTNLRKVNFFLDNSYKCPDAKVRAKYDGIARFFRAYFYFDMVKRFGDVPWYSHVFGETDQEQLYKKRDSRILVMDSMLVDINYAIANLGTTKKLNEVTKWTALALKSRFCLFEGTYRKYHGISGWEKFIDESISASEALVAGKAYSIYTTGGKEVAYRDLFASINANAQEVITARGYSAELQIFHNCNYYTLTSSYGQPGLEKQLIESYLMADGSRFTDIKDYDKMFYADEMKNRDPRLYQTVRGPGYTRVNSTTPEVPQFGYTVTGYQPIKYVCAKEYDMYNKNENDLIIYRYAEVLLNLAEAKAEKGTLTQGDIDITIKLLRDRVGMPNLNMAEANAKPDPFMEAQYPLVSGANKGVILEIRRERRVELVMENLRYYDMMRWKAGKQFERQFKGIYIPGPGFYDMDGDGKNDLCIHEKGKKPSDLQGASQVLEIGTNIILEKGNYGNIVINPNIKKKWNENRDYLFPIPITEVIMNPDLAQNPGWEM